MAFGRKSAATDTLADLGHESLDDFEGQSEPTPVAEPKAKSTRSALNLRDRGQLTNGLDRNKVTIIVAALAIFFAFPVQFAMSMRGGALDEAKSYKAQQTNLSPQIAALDRVSGNQAEYLIQASALELGAPVSPDAEVWIGSIALLADSLGLTVTSITAADGEGVAVPGLSNVAPEAVVATDENGAAIDETGAPIAESGLSSLALNVEIKGSERSTAEFLGQMSKLNRLFAVTSVDLSIDDGLVSASVQVTAFYFPTAIPRSDGEIDRATLEEAYEAIFGHKLGKPQVTPVASVPTTVPSASTGEGTTP